MEDIKLKQDKFFNALKIIQEEVVYSALGEYTKDNSLEELLFNVTYQTIYEVLELIDGYKDKKLRLDLIDKDNKISMRTGIELHDKCADYLKNS